MGNSEDFQRQFAALMKNILHSAVTETTKLFESAMHEMKTELMWIRKQNDKVTDNATICSKQGGCIPNCQGNPCKRDIGVQCATPTLVEESNSSSQHEDIDKNRLSDLFPGFLQDENQQFTLLFIKPEEPDMCDYTPACLLPKLADNQPRPILVQHIEAPIMNQETGLLLGRLSPCQGLTDNPTAPSTHNHTASPPQSVQEPSAPETLQSQKLNPLQEFHASVDPLPDRVEEKPVLLLQPPTPTSYSTQRDATDGSISAAPKDVAKVSYGDQPRRLSARKSKSVYRRAVDLEIPQPSSENIPQANDAISPTRLAPAEVHKETSKKSSKQLSRNQIDKNQNDREQHRTNKRQKNQCEVCDLVLSSSSALKHHWKVHGAERDSVCYRCGKIFPNDRSLKCHLRTHTLGKPQSSEDVATLEIEPADSDIDQESLGLHQNTHQDQPRRLSARKSKSVYRRLVDQETPQLRAENTQHRNDTSEPTCHVPTKIPQKTEKNSEQPSRNQLDKHENEKPDMIKRQKNQCEVCELVLSSASALKHHWKVHRAERDSVCYRCGKIFPDDRSLRCHLLIHTLGKSNQQPEDAATPKTEPADCELDQQSLISLQRVNQDQSRKLNARKSVYRRLVDLETTRPSPENIPQSNEPSASTCYVATKVYKKTDKSFRQHSRNKSYKNQPGRNHRHKNQCKVCGRVLCSASSLLHHQRVHKGERPFACDECGKAFFDKKGLRRHLFIHTLDKRNRCSEDVAITKTDNVDCEIDQQSMRSLQKTNQDQPRRISARKSKSVYRRQVDLEAPQPSSENIQQSSALLHHQRVHMDRPFVCDRCGKTFPDEQGLRRHSVIHTKRRHQCLQCGRTFLYRYLLTHHHQIKHTDEKPSPCRVCGKRFASKASAAAHIRLHSGERLHSCIVCSKEFVEEKSLKIHMLRHGEKSYSCLTCGKRFVNRSDLKTHERIHTGEKPYECKICGMSFRQSSHLRSHVSNRHNHL
ncbi:zinc finger protein 420-like [Alosa sapidissima]|uniref:zinc finger protein 420-like n=1 Tax=Alosa sapidissima TaxID=34773 RepID=UPI001C08A85C|nr:zinc finger protein 420-like [Alosa sapidissima]